MNVQQTLLSAAFYPPLAYIHGQLKEPFELCWQETKNFKLENIINVTFVFNSLSPSLNYFSKIVLTMVVFPAGQIGHKRMREP
jgi:hypothetical protein